MEQSNLNNPQIDETLKHHDQSFLQGAPVDSRVREDKRDEGPGPRPGQPSASAQPQDRKPGVSESGVTPETIDLRAELATYLRPTSSFPATREQLLDIAQEEHAPESILRSLKELPDRQFGHFEDVWESMPAQR